ncbi:hypothetical protein [Neobacillus vireti]|uniref:Uncharacterized protein n=1 Tax=Neobacillus vireti LMG 21834 TaxID=1131730 RepID=A0AB94IR06_9BACI|nr:hypothetical protein [Neobacillus vireti]ETI69442.1 hypothetical protein BAVI_07686 [Neobacillus vireti LMG 21834]KLT18911.1 hypothetical protein AA980_06150 [Neobacillus vireti]
MKLFTEDSSLKSMNEVLAARISSYNLIGDLPLSKEDFIHLASIVTAVYESDVGSRILYRYKECLAVFLVFCAVYEYDNGAFWKQMEKYIGNLTYNRRMDLYSIFSEVVDKYQLNKFENESEDGFTYVTPILCHAGIPINALDSYFAAISNTVNDYFYDDFDVDDFLIYLKNKTEMPVKRYIKLSNKRDSYSFIQNSRNLILNDSVESDVEIDSGNYTRMFDQISSWKEKPKNKKTLQARSNVQITAPKIKVDLDGVGIYCEFPRIVVKDCYDSYLIWEITSDETTNLVKSDFFRRSGVLVSEEKIFTLRPASSYTITLKVDDNQISKWEFEGVKNNYIAFAQNGNIIKSEGLPNNSVILLLNKDIDIKGKEQLSIIELPPIPSWTAFNVFKVDLSNLKMLECIGFTIRVNAETKPLIIGGETLFHQENSRAYITLPYIKVPVINEGEWHIEIKHRSGSEVITKSNVVVPSDREVIPLSSYINKGTYGEYEIKIWNRTGMNGKLAIEYVPFGTLQVDRNDYWPSSYQGYVNQIQLLRTSKNVELEMYNAEKVSEIHQDDYILHRYKVNEKDRFLIGEYKYTYNEKVFSTSIKKGMYPISWGMIGLENEIIEFSNKLYTLTIEDFSQATNPYLLFAFNLDATYDIQDLRIDLVGADKKIVQSNNISIKNKDGLRIPLNSYLFEVQNTTTEIDYHLRVTLIDSNENIVSSFLVARFQDEVVVKNATFKQNENDIFFGWEETGTRCGREIVLFNFLKPWLNPYHFRIEDKTSEVNIPTQVLEEGVYKYLIQKETDDLFIDESESEICSLRDFQKGIIEVKGKQHYSTDMERILYQILRTRYLKRESALKKLTKIESEISSIRIRVPEDITLLANAYILHDRFFLGKEDASIVMKLFGMLFDLFSSCGNETMKYVLESDFSTKYRKELLHKFYCNNLTSPTRMNEFQYNLLAEIDEDMAGFINLIQSEHNAKGLNWAGISGIEVLREEDIFGEGDSNATFLSDENLGKSSYITNYFQYVSTSLLRPKNMTKNTADFLREFQRDHAVQETLIFGKTRLHLLAEWKNHNKSASLIQERLAQVLDFPCDRDLKDQFKDVFKAISKRRADDELGYYIGLIALYASFIRNGRMTERKGFSHLLHYTIRSCEKLYYRDAIIIELYMHLERGYSWV